MPAPQPSPAAVGGMKPRTFAAFRQLVLQQCGISLGDSKLALVSSRIGKRLRALGLSSAEAYLEHLRHDDGDEMVQFLDAISTNVTSFFREEMHFRFISTQVAEWLAQGQRRFRFWSAACSTGEEPLTLAMVLDPLFAGQHVDWRILATDLSTKALRTGQQGQYSADRLKTMPASLLKRYFQSTTDAAGQPCYEADATIHDRVVWRRTNLSKPPFPLKGPLDIIMCRNVMIYFDTDVRRRLVHDLCRLLRPGGFLIVGAAESLSGIIDGYRLVQPSVYRKQ